MSSRRRHRVRDTRCTLEARWSSWGWKEEVSEKLRLQIDSTQLYTLGYCLTTVLFTLSYRKLLLVVERRRVSNVFTVSELSPIGINNATAMNLDFTTNSAYLADIDKCEVRGSLSIEETCCLIVQKCLNDSCALRVLAAIEGMSLCHITKVNLISVSTVSSSIE